MATRPMFAGCVEHGHGDPAHGIRGVASVVSAELRLYPAVAVARVATACELVAELPPADPTTTDPDPPPF